MSWAPTIGIGKLRPWPDTVRVARGKAEPRGHTVDVREYEPKRGECHDKNGFDEDMGFECTKCGAMVDSYMTTTECAGVAVQFNYCPCCGAEVMHT